MSAPRYCADALLAYANQLLTAAGLAPTHAEAVARTLVDGDLLGHDTHGLALLAGQRFGRTLALIAGFLSLSEIPLGLTLGVYSLIVLLPLPAGYATTSARDQVSALRHHPSAT